MSFVRVSVCKRVKKRRYQKNTTGEIHSGWKNWTEKYRRNQLPRARVNRSRGRRWSTDHFRTKEAGFPISGGNRRRKTSADLRRMPATKIGHGFPLEKRINKTELRNHMESPKTTLQYIKMLKPSKKVRYTVISKIFVAHSSRSKGQIPIHSSAKNGPGTAYHFHANVRATSQCTSERSCGHSKVCCVVAQTFAEK